MIGKHHDQYTSCNHYKNTANIKYSYLWALVTPFMLYFSSVMQKYLLRFIVSLQFIFRQYGVVPSGIVGGFEALSDNLIVTKNLVTPHHKDVKELLESFGTWLQEDLKKELVFCTF